MPTFTEPEVVNDTRILPPYHVILLNDEDHTYQYVIHMLQKSLNDEDSNVRNAVSSALLKIRFGS